MMKKILLSVAAFAGFAAFLLAPAAFAQHSLTTTYLSTERPNDGSTGTTVQRLAKINSSGNAITIATSDTAVPVYIVGTGAGTTGNAELAVSGQAPCDFDATAVTAAHWVQISTTTAGKCHDAGATFPTSGGDIVGYAVTSGSGSTTQTVQVFSPGLIPSAGGGSGITSVTAGAGLSTTLGSTGGSITTSGTLYKVAPVNAQTGTTYTVVDGDQEKLVTLSNTAAVAVTLPQAGAGSAFLAGWRGCFKNINTGLVTITPATSTWDGNAATTLPKNQTICARSDGTNYFTDTQRTRSVITMSNSATVAASTTKYFSLIGGAPSSSSEAGAQMHWPIPGTFRQFCIDQVTTVATGNLVITLRVNTAAPSGGPVITLTPGATSGCSTTGSATVAANDLVAVQFDATANTAGSGANLPMSIVFEPGS